MSVRRAANLAWQFGGDRALILTLADGADVLELFECRTITNEPVDVASVLGPEWDVRQDLTDAARAGSAIAVRRAGPVRYGRRISWQLLSRAGRNVQDRFLLSAVLVDKTFPFGARREVKGVGHNPIKDSGRQDDAVRSWTAWVRRQKRAGFTRISIDADVNMDPGRFAREVGLPHYFGADVMVSAYSSGWGLVRHRRLRVPFTDHFVLASKATAVGVRGRRRPAR